MANETRGTFVKVPSGDRGELNCYLAMPRVSGRVPAIVLASAIHGVDQDLCEIANEFAAHGLIAAAPDLFWRTIPGPLPPGDSRAAQRSQPRSERIKAGEADMKDTLDYLGRLREFNGAAAVIGFCYGGPYAVIGPRRLGYVAGISCHGTRMLDYIEELDAQTKPVCIIWGDQDSHAPATVRNAYRDAAAPTKNIEAHILPGILHGYMMRGSHAFDEGARGFSMARALALSLEASAQAP